MPRNEPAVLFADKMPSAEAQRRAEAAVLKLARLIGRQTARDLLTKGAPMPANENIDDA
jgi:hypothetical protein